MAENELDLAKEKPGDEPAPISDKPLDPSLVLRFAKQIMLGCAIVGTMFAFLALVGPPALLPASLDPPSEFEKYILSTGTEMMRVVTVVIPPIIALVIGFYFGKKNNDRG
jgi:hypothetical protein